MPVSVNVLAEGLYGYPPAVLLQAGFVAPLVLVLAWPHVAVFGREALLATEAISKAHTAEDLLYAILTVEALQGEKAGETLHRVAAQARVILMTHERPRPVLVAAPRPGSAPPEPAAAPPESGEANGPGG